MRIPNKIKIGWKKYRVVRRNPKRELVEVANYRWGEIDYDKRELVINESADKQNAEATFIHEIIHGISEMYKLDFEERTVEILGDALYTFVKDNPKIFM